MDDAGNTLVRVSLDMLVAKDRHPEGPGKGLVVPLTWARKGPMTRFDVSVAEGHAHTLTTQQNAECVADALAVIAEGVVTSHERFREDFVAIATARPEEAARCFQDLVARIAYVEGASRNARVVFLLALAQFIDKYVLLVEVHGVTHSRTTVKYCYDAGSGNAFRPNVRAHRIAWGVGAFGFASSTHVEVEVPAPLALTSSRIVNVLTPEMGGAGIAGVEELASTDESSSIHHLVAVPESVWVRAELESNIGVSESTVTRVALFSATAGAALCTYLFVGTWEMWMLGLVGLNVEPSTSLLLAAAGALGPLLGRGPKHWLVATYVKPFRDTTTIAGGTLFLTALVIGTMPAEPLLAWVQGALMVLSFAVLGYSLQCRRYVVERRSIKESWRARGRSS